MMKTIPSSEYQSRSTRIAARINYEPNKLQQTSTSASRLKTSSISRVLPAKSRIKQPVASPSQDETDKSSSKLAKPAAVVARARPTSLALRGIKTPLKCATQIESKLRSGSILPRLTIKTESNNNSTLHKVADARKTINDKSTNSRQKITKSQLAHPGKRIFLVLEEDRQFFGRLFVYQQLALRD